MNHVVELFNCLSQIENPAAKKNLGAVIRGEVDYLLKQEIPKPIKEKELYSKPYYVTKGELRTANSGQKLEAVKMHKSRTNSSLMDSKRSVEFAMEYYGPNY